MATKKKTPSRAGGRPPRTVNITPEMAQEWLEKNVHNRPINDHRIRRYAEDMKTGNWQVTGDAIRFSKSGMLLDGQHRLWACVEADTAFPSVVYTGLPEETQLLMDQGMPRSKGSQLTILGYKRGATLASAAINIWRMERGRTMVFARASSPSNSEVLTVIENNPDLLDRIEEFFSIKASSGMKIQQGSTIAMYMYMHRFSPSKAEEFLKAYLTGVNLGHGDPAWALRERVLQYKNKGWKILHTDFLTWAAYAWKAHLQGRKLQRISPKNELPEFPGSPAWDSMAEE